MTSVPTDEESETAGEALVSYTREGLVVAVKVGATLLEASEACGAPHGSHCGGVCGCSTCHVYVRSGGELLSAIEADEERLLGGALDRNDESRLGCQAVLLRPGRVLVEITDESFETWLDAHPSEQDRALALRGIG